MVYNLPEVGDAFEEYELSLMDTVEHLKGELNTIRAGRANPQILNKITVDYYGALTPLNQMANITATDDGKVIRLVFPQLTEERRRDLGKQVKKIGEDYKVTLRNARRDIMDKLKAFNKNKQITDDEIASYEKEVQKILDKNIASVDALVKEKESEILEV